jgi:iterative type I PKS product template protein
VASQLICVFTGNSDLNLPRQQELFRTFRYFKYEVCRLDRCVQRLHFESILPVFENGSTDTVAFSRSQLAHVIGEIAMFNMLRSWGIHPSFVVGHSLGEFAALCAAGILSAADMIYLVGTRAKILEEQCTMYENGMLLVRTSLEHVRGLLQARLNEELELACINSPGETVFSGPSDILEEARTMLESRSVKCVKLQSPLAFHSSQMDGVAAALMELATHITLNDPQIPLLSPLLNTVVRKANQLDPTYLAHQTRETVNFKAILQTCMHEGIVDDSTVWLEIGPHAVCTPMIRSTICPGMRYASMMRKDESVRLSLAKTTTLLYSAGIDIDWKQYQHDSGEGQRLITLPSYAFDEQNYWIVPKQKHQMVQAVPSPVSTLSSMQKQEAAPQTPPMFLSKTIHRLASRTEQSGFLLCSFETDLCEAELFSVLNGHVMNEACLCPASIYADVALAIGEYMIGHEFKKKTNLGVCIAELDIQKPIIVPPVKPSSSFILTIIAHVDLDDKRTKLRFETRNPTTGATSMHAKCNLIFEQRQLWSDEWSKKAATIQSSIGLLEAGLLKGSSQRLMRDLTYRIFDATVKYDSRFKSVKEITVDVDKLCASATLDLYNGPDSRGYLCCPFWMDGFAHVAGFMLNGLKMKATDPTLYISPGWDSFRLVEGLDPAKQYSVYVEMHELDNSKIKADCYFLQEDVIVGKIGGLNFQLIPRAILDKILPPAHSKVLPTNQKSPPPSRTAILTPIAPAARQKMVKPAVGTQPVFKVKDIISEETGVPLAQLTSQSSVIDLGIDSLLSLTILGRLKDEFGLNPPGSLFADCLTIGALEAKFKELNPDVEHAEGAVSSAELPIYTPQTSSSDDMNDIAECGPSECLSHSIRSIVSEQMGIQADSIQPTDNLFDLGLDSLMSMEIADVLRDRLRLDFETSLLTTCNTLALLEEALLPLKTANLEPPKTETNLLVDAARPQTLSICVQGDPKQGGKRLFLFPDGSGAAAAYAQLPKIDSDTCVYALNSPYLKQGVNSSIDLVQLVSTWVHDIRSRQPSGPYLLGGWSVGGYYAYEAAKLLIAEQEVVDKVICIDTPSRNVYEAMPEDVLSYLATSGTMGELGQPAPVWLREHFLSTIRAVSRYTPVPLSGSSLPLVYLIWAEEGAPEIANATHRIAGFGSRVAKFFVESKGDVDPHGWQDLVPVGNIHMTQTAGNHFTMMFPPQAQQLSSLIGAALRGEHEHYKQLAQANLPKYIESFGSMTVPQQKEHLSYTYTDSEARTIHDLQYLSYLYVHRALAHIPEPRGLKLPSYLERYHQWMQHQERLAHEQGIDTEVSDAHIKDAETRALKSAGVDGAMLVRIGQHLESIIRGSTTPLPLMLRNKLLHKYYENTLRVRSTFAQVEVLARHIAAQHPEPGIIEIGAGTGSCTQAVLKALAKGGKGCNKELFAHYTYTDVSSGFFNDARKRFGEYTSLMSFRTLNHSSDLTAQGFDPASYDMAVACQCLHVTSDVVRTMSHVRRLLKKGGKLLMVETTTDSVDVNLIFGVLEGWWMSEYFCRSRSSTTYR